MRSRRAVELLLAFCPRQREKQCGSLVATRHSQTLPGRSLSIRERGESYPCSTFSCPKSSISWDVGKAKRKYVY